MWNHGVAQHAQQHRPVLYQQRVERDSSDIPRRALISTIDSIHFQINFMEQEKCMFFDIILSLPCINSQPGVGLDCQKWNRSHLSSKLSAMHSVGESSFCKSKRE